MRITLLFIFLAFASVAHAQGGYWQHLNGPTGGYSEAIASGSDGTIYLMTQMELWKRTPNDAGWKKASSLPSNFYDASSPQLVTVDGKLFLLGMQDQPIMAVSSDEGETWVVPDTALAGICNANGVLYGIPSRIINGAPWTDEISRSTDSGRTWKVVFTDSGFSFTSITYGANGNFLVNGGAPGQSDIFTNIKGDSVWINYEEPWTGMVSNPNILEVGNNIAIASGRYVYRSTDDGIGWSQLSEDSIFEAGPVSMDSNGTLWTVGMREGFPPFDLPPSIMYSKDSGQTWQRGNFNALLLENGNGWFQSFCVSPSNDLFLQTVYGEYLYNRQTSEWSPWEDSLRISNIFGILPFSDDSILIACLNGYFRTNDGGMTWYGDSGQFTLPGIGPSINQLLFLRDREGTLFAGGSKFVTDSQKWVFQYDTLPRTGENPLWGNPQFLTIDSSDYLYATENGYNYYLLRSSDKGTSWSILSQSGNWWLHMTVDSKGRIFASIGASGTGGYIVRSSDNGESWDTLYRSLPPRFDDIGAICVTQNGTILATDAGHDDTGYYSMIESTDSGNTWQYYRTFSPIMFVLDGTNKVYATGLVDSTHVIFSDTVIPPTYAMLSSIDTGITGQIFYSTKDTGFSMLAVTPSQALLAGTIEDGLFRYIPSAADVTVPQTAESTLSIYPNPTTGLVTISGNGLGTVTIENEIGIQVPSNANRAPSNGSATVDLTGEPAGIYFLRIETARGAVMQKIVKE